MKCLSILWYDYTWFKVVKGWRRWFKNGFRPVLKTEAHLATYGSLNEIADLGFWLASLGPRFVVAKWDYEYRNLVVLKIAYIED